MATESRRTYELPHVSSYSPAPRAMPVVTQQPQANQTVTVVATWWTLLENAAQRVYGPNIYIHQLPFTTTNLDQLVADINFTVVNSDPQPREVRCTIVDINSKEYINRSEREKDETVLKVGKWTPLATGDRYHFHANNGIFWGTNGNIGAQIVSMAMAGGAMRVGYSNEQSTGVYGQENSVNRALQFNYNQEEKISIPPGVKAKATITTSAIKFEQGYTLEFYIPSSRSVPFTYTKPDCCSCGKSYGSITAADLFQTLPNYRLANGMAHFSQSGKLTWVGESCSVEKTEEPL